MAVFGNLGGKFLVVDDVVSSHEQEIYPTTSFDANCTAFEVQTDSNYYLYLRQPYLALKLNFLKGRGYETYNSKEVKKEHKEDAKADEAGEEEEEEEEEEEDDDDDAAEEEEEEEEEE